MLRWIFMPWLAVMLLAQSCSGELQSAPPKKPSGLMKISVVVINPEVSLEKPVLEVASCEIPVTVPGGRHQAYVEQQGMAVEIGWDKVSELRQPDGTSGVDFKNFRCELRNEIEFTWGGTCTPGPLFWEKLALTSGAYRWFLAQGSLAISHDAPEWMKPLHWTIGATWNPGSAEAWPKISVIESYQKAHPELGK